MTDREHRHSKKEWRKQKQRYRKGQKEKTTLEDNLVTPPLSPVTPNPPSRQYQQGVKKSKVHKAKCYRDNALLKAQLDKTEKKVEMYRKRWKRSSRNADCWRWTQKKKHPKFLSPVNPTHLGYRKSLRKNPANLGYKKSLLKNPANLGYKKSLLMDPTNLGYQKSFLKNPANLGYKKSLLKNPANLGYQKSLRKNPANLGYQKSLRKYSSLKIPQPKTASANMSL
ncbi:hypothetical protein ACOMHN_023978 [Nucella lapillus]